MPASSASDPARSRRLGLARVVSKAGVCSRTEAARWIVQGRVSINGSAVRDPEHPVRAGKDRVCVDGRPLGPAARCYIALNKPRGLITTVRDEDGRDTVYRCFADAGLPWVAPVGRLDRASEGLLLFSNDSEWAASITEAAAGPVKVYHVRIDAVPDAATVARIAQPLRLGKELLRAESVALLRAGERNAWLEVRLTEGRNRQIRRLLEAHGLKVLRLVRVAIGTVTLGTLGKGDWRHLSEEEVRSLAGVRIRKST